MLGYLFFDGFTSTFQDKLFVGYKMETYNQMLWVNFCSAFISVFYLVSDGSFEDAIAFIQRHPMITGDILILSIAAMLGQLCILYTIKVWGVVVRDHHDDETVLEHLVELHRVYAHVVSDAVGGYGAGVWFFILQILRESWEFEENCR